MSIVFVTPRSWPLKGGVESHVHNLAEAISELQEDNVGVFSQYIKADEDYIKRFKNASYFTNFFKIGGPSYYAVSLGLIRKAIKAFNSGDILHLQASHKPLAALLLLLLKRNQNDKGRVFFTMHYHGGGHGWIASIAHIFYRPILGLALKHANRIIAVSAPEKELIIKHFPKIKENVVVIPNGVGNVQQVKNGTEVTVISRLEKYKNIDKVIKNIPEGIKLNIVGEGSHKNELEKLASNNPNIIFHGALNSETYEAVWAKTGVLLSLSSKEAYGMVIAEAIARGVSVIASNIPAHKFIHEISGNNTLLHFEEEDLKTQISAVINDKSDKIGYNFFSWQDAAKMTLDLYEEEVIRAKNII